ncbi:MAG: hypothetical protein ACAI25_18180, partial [Planctomycetota bacterium]
RRGLSMPELEWVLITCAKYVEIDPAPKRGAPYFSVPPLELHWFRVRPGLRSEPAIFYLARYPSTHVHGGRRRKVPGRSTWSSRYTCKTQYASNHGPQHFLRCHLGLIALLDRAKELGIRVSVRDDGGFARSRSVPKLIEKLSWWNELVAGFGAALGAALPPGTKAVGGLHGRADLEHLEAKGLARWKGLTAFVKKLAGDRPKRRRR